MDAGERARYFIKGSDFRSELSVAHPAGAKDDVECRVVLRLPWPDAGRASRALQMIDAELRRASRALVNAGADDDDLDVFVKESDRRDPVERFRSALLDFPGPHATGAGHLKILSVASTPLVVLLEPSGLVSDLLRRYPLGAAMFAMSVFGLRMAVRVHTGARLEAAEFGTPDGARDAIDRALWQGDWHGSNMGSPRHYDTPGRPGLFRGVSPATETRGTENNASLGIYLFSPSGGDGYFAAVQATDSRSTTSDYGTRLPRM